MGERSGYNLRGLIEEEKEYDDYMMIPRVELF